MGLAKQAIMLSTAVRNHKHEGNQLSGGRSSRRSRGRASEPAGPHLKAVGSDPDAVEAVDSGLGDVAGLPIGRMPEGDEDAGNGAGAAEAAAPVVEPSLSDYSTIGAYLHELRRYPLMTREEEHEVAVRFCKEHEGALASRLITANLRLVVKIA